MGDLIVADARPVDGFRGGSGFRKIVHNGLKSPLRFLVSAAGECSRRQSQLKLRQQIRGRQEALNAAPFGAVRFADKQRGSPVDSKAFHVLRLFFHVDFDRNEMVGHELADSLLGIDRGIQPGTAASIRSSREVE